MQLTVNLAPGRPGGLILKNPIMTAAGPYGYGKELSRLTNLTDLGALVTRGVTLHAQAGGAPPRLEAAPAGVLHRVGRPNPGLRAVIRDYGDLWAAWASAGLPVIVNIAGQTASECATMGALLDGAPGVAAVEMDLAIPVESAWTPDDDGRQEAAERLVGHDPALARQYILALRDTCSLPLLVKLPPRLPGLSQVVQAVAQAGADAVTLCAAWPALSIGPDGRREVKIASLSGPAVRPLALRCLWEVARTLPGLPLVASGGVETGADAAAFLMAGATAVQVGAASLLEPLAPLRVLGGLESYLQKEGITDIQNLVGAALEAAPGAAL
jgi:dihydroorotate dehydrogenase (NAD+) catalytic subunit